MTTTETSTTSLPASGVAGIPSSHDRPARGTIESNGWRRIAAGGLVVAGIFLAGFTVLEPPFHSDGVRALGEVQHAPVASAISHTMFVVAQLPLLLGLLAFVHVVRDRSPRLAMATAVLCTIGSFGHMVYGGFSGVRLELAGEADVERMGRLLETLEASPMLGYAVAGLLGTVLGTVLLAVLASRTRAVPRWVGPGLGAFVVLEFFLSNAVSWLSFVAGGIYALAMFALARAVWTAAPDRLARHGTH